MANDNEDLMKHVLAKLDKVDEKIDTKFDKVEFRLDSVDRTLIKQEANLGEHMRRTELLELEVAPIKKHVVMVQGVLKFIGVVSLIVGIATGIASLFHLI